MKFNLANIGIRRFLALLLLCLSAILMYQSSHLTPVGYLFFVMALLIGFNRPLFKSKQKK